MTSPRFFTSLRTGIVRATVTAAAVAAAVLAIPSSASAQKALVYCPVGIDVAGCTNLLTALQPVFPSGVDRGYDGSSGTVDLRTANLWSYALIVVPSLATTGGATPYAVLADTAMGSRMHDAILGRFTLWSGTPDLGSPNGTQKDTLIQSLARWASGSFSATKGPGLVVYQDQSDSIATQYGWLHVIAGTAIQADSSASTYASVQGVTPTGAALLRDPSGNTIAYANMASYGFLNPASGSGFSIDGVALAGAGTQNVLLTSLGGNTGAAVITTDADDYAPGSIVTITGSGFAAGEKVTITLRERPHFDTPPVITAVADKTGAFVDRSFSPDSADVDVRFIATAVGASSGMRAVTTFTDAAPSAVNIATQSPTPVVPGSDATFGITVVIQGNSGGSCTIGLSATPSGTPAWPSSGVTFSFNPSSVTGQKGQSPASSLTIHTPSGMSPSTYHFTVTASGPCQGNGTQTVTSTGDLTVGAIAGNTSVSSSASTSTFGQSVTFTATVSPATGTSTPTGSIQFLDNGANLGAAVPLSNGVASLTTAALGAGTHTISATYQPGTGFSTGSVSAVTQQVNKATAVVTWATPPAISYGTALSALQLNAAATPAAGAFVYTPASGTVLGAGTQTRSVVFTPTDATDYNAGSASVTLAVNKLAATLSADNQTRQFGQANPTLTGSLGGFLPSDNISATYATTATQTSNVGTYPITATLVDPNGRAGNYAVSQTAGTLTITQATQTISFTAPSGLHYGDADVALGATATSGLVVSYVSSTPTVCTIAGASVHIVSAGNCTVDAQQAGDPNHAAATPVSQTFAITQRAIGVIADASGKTYGAADPPLTYTVSAGSLVGGDAFSGALSRAPGENAGTYAIGQGTLTAGSNYALTFTGAQFTIARANQTISFTQPANPTFGDPPLPLSATASSGLAVTFAAAGTCSIGQGGALSILGAGSCTVTASQAGDGNHNAAPDVVYTLTINKATPSVVAQGGTFTYDGQTHAATGSATGVGGATLTPVAVTYNGSSALPKNAGTYAVLASFGGTADYLPGTASTTITITQKPLSITADDRTKVYGGATPAFTALYSGFVPGEGPTDLSGTLAFGGTAASATDAGTYAITPSGVSSPNYAITFTNGTLTITKAPLSVTVDNVSRVYGDPNPTFTGQLSGVVNNDNITASYSSAATVASPVGTIPITATLSDPNNRLGNYDVTNTPGALTITPAPLTVTPANASRLYGDADPAFTGTVSGIKNNDPITATYSTAATPASPVGTYAIVETISDPSNVLGNYSVTLNDGTLSVTPAPLTISAANATRVYGAPNPSFTGTITGIRNNDGITATYTTAATPGSDVGTYSIVPKAVDATPTRLGNYTVTLNNGTLTITQATPTVNWSQPAAIPQGTALSATQLNATSTGVGGASVAGTFTYTPPAGTVLYGVGTTPLAVAFASSNGNYTGASGAVQISVQNVAPRVISLTLGAAPVAVNTTTSVNATFTDPGLQDTHTAVIDWGDGTTSAGSMSDVGLSTPTGGVSGSHSYSAAGVYTVTVTVTDNNGGSGTLSSSSQTIGYIVVYDPSAGFVTGGGWISSPAGACQLTTACGGATGKANFGFNARYQKGANTPDGSTEFQFQAGGLNFKSTYYQWLVVAGSKAQYKGTGSINGKGTYNFLLTAIDGDLQGGKPDAFRIKITDPSTGAVVYDNQMTADDTSSAATTLGGGSIVIHQ